MSIAQSQEDLEDHLREQLSFLISSATAYDNGNSSEAKRLAVVLRVLLHDTANSKSLLAQLGMKERQFYDSSNYQRYNKTPWDVAVYTGLVGQCINIDSGQVSYIPILDRKGDEPPQWAEFSFWWTMAVMKDEIGNTFSRKDLVLTMANQDGGVHVDPVITGKYAALSRQNSLGWKGSINGNAHQPLPHPERSAIRQIAHEVNKSLDLNYTKEVELGGAYFIAYNVAAFLEPLKKRIGRNELCPCGSGKKYKQCHGSL